MLRALGLIIIVIAALATAGTTMAQQRLGSAADAKAMLERAIMAVRADRTAALAKFNRGDDGFRDRDLYVFCVGLDGATLSHGDPAMLGRDIKSFRDPTGKQFGEEILREAREGRISEVSYMFPRPGETEPVAKESYVTRIGDLVCGVGFYK